MTEKRLLVLYCGIFAFALMVEAKMIHLMCSGYDILAEKQTVRTVDISAGRADITDCNLNKITGTEDVLKAFITDETQLQNIYSYIREADREKLTFSYDQNILAMQGGTKGSKGVKGSK